MSPEKFALFVPELIEAGATFIGRCCGANSEFIAAVRKKIR
jgi:S-methylmethionine-dependent homocysteine/selenocysteine methylase